MDNLQKIRKQPDSDSDHWYVHEDNFTFVLELIKYKFTSLPRFAELAKMDYMELRKSFARFRKGMNDDKRRELKKIMNKVSTIDPDKELKSEITSADRKRLKNKLQSVGGVLVFCQRNKKFATASVFKILDGTRKRKTKKVRELFTKLNIKQNGNH